MRLLPPIVVFVVASSLSACGGCDRPSEASSPDAGAPPPSPTPTASASAPAAPPAPSPSASSAASPGVFKVLRLTLTSDVKDKQPVDELVAAGPGQRVYAHLTLRNRTGAERKVRLRFRVNGDQRTEVELKVEPSWSYRTWGYNTLLPADTKGEVVLQVADEEGQSLVEARLPIQAKASTRPAP